jgi:3-phenylpropionate/trans-cinnamate dioxygenase ferredoxin subunit
MPSGPPLVDVGGLDEFEEGRPKVVRVAGRELGIVRWRNLVYAVRNICPHMGAQLGVGTVAGLRESDGPMSQLTIDVDRPVISCPWHGWTFELATGLSVFDPGRFRVKSYPVTVVRRRVLVDISARS